MRFCVSFVLAFTAAVAAVPVEIKPIAARNGMVVAAHPQSVEAGLAVLKAGGNAIDAAVATSLAVGVAEPYGSGLGGKLMLLYYDAKSGRTYAVEAMDAAGSLDVAAYLKRPTEDRSYGYGSVCVPGLGAGLWAAHQKWGVRPWSENIAPAIALARAGFRVLPKARDLFAEQEKKLRRGDREIARLYLRGGKLPEAGALLPNEDLARTMEEFARHGRDGFYRGPVAEAIVAASRVGGGVLTMADFARYEARIVEPVSATFRGYTLHLGSPPTSGAAMILPIMKALESESLTAPLRAAETIDRIGRVWRVVIPEISRTIADVPESRARMEKLLSPASIARIQAKARVGGSANKTRKTAGRDASRPQYDERPGFEGQTAPALVAETAWYESPAASTTHFVIADRRGNIVCATQSQSLHFGAGVVPPGTGVVLNNSMSNFTFHEPGAINFVAPGKRPRSTISPTIVVREGKPVFAAGIPGGGRIPTAMLQLLLDRLALNRPLADSIGDTRIHFVSATRAGDTESFEAEQSYPHAEAQALRERGWRVNLPEPAGTGRYFGGINAIELNADGSLTGYADPRRTNVARGY